MRHSQDPQEGPRMVLPLHKWARSPQGGQGSRAGRWGRLPGGALPATPVLTRSGVGSAGERRTGQPGAGGAVCRVCREQGPVGASSSHPDCSSTWAGTCRASGLSGQTPFPGASAQASCGFWLRVSRPLRRKALAPRWRGCRGENGKEGKGRRRGRFAVKQP